MSFFPCFLSLSLSLKFIVGGSCIRIVANRMSMLICLCDSQLQMDKNDKWFWHRNDEIHDAYTIRLNCIRV